MWPWLWKCLYGLPFCFVPPTIIIFSTIFLPSVISLLILYPPRDISHPHLNSFSALRMSNDVRGNVLPMLWHPAWFPTFCALSCGANSSEWTFLVCWMSRQDKFFEGTGTSNTHPVYNFTSVSTSSDISHPHLNSVHKCTSVNTPFVSNFLFSGDLWSFLPTGQRAVASTDGHFLQGGRADWRRGKKFHWWILPVTSICRGCIWHASQLQTHPLTWSHQQSDDAEVSWHLGAVWKRGNFGYSLFHSFGAVTLIFFWKQTISIICSCLWLTEID